MPVYPYSCACGAQFEIYQPIDGDHTLTSCQECGGVAQRVWTAPYAWVDNTQPHFNHGLGVEVRNKGDIKDAQKRYRDETGSSLIELGTEKNWRAKRQRIEYPRASEILA